MLWTSFEIQTPRRMTSLRPFECRMSPVFGSQLYQEWSVKRCHFLKECQGKNRRKNTRSQKPVTRSCQKLVWADAPDTDQILDLDTEKLKKLQFNNSIEIQHCKSVNKDPIAVDNQAGAHLSKTNM